MKGLIFRRAKGQSQENNENPYLNARRTLNDRSVASANNLQMFQIFGILALLIALASVGGVIHLGSQSKLVPYVVEVDKLGQTVAVAPAERAAAADPRIMHASLAAFISDLRMVTPDIALQRKAVFRVYALLSTADPATAKTTEWYNEAGETNPFKRAAKEMVNIEISSVIPQTPNTWQVDWVETIRDRQGLVIQAPYRMRALVTAYIGTSPANEEEIRLNPIGIYVRDYNWSKQL